MQRPAISPFRLAMRHGMFIPVLLIIGALVLFVLARDLAVESRLLAAEGVETTALVEDRERRQRRDSEGRVTYTYFLRISIAQPDGSLFRQTRQVSQRIHDAVRIGDRIALRYVPARPRVNRLEGESTVAARVGMNIGSSVLLMVALVLAWFGTGRLRAMLRAARRGPAGQARVMGWEEMPVKARRNNESVRFMRMTWRDDGHNRTGRTLPVKEPLVAGFPPGTPITVWHDPDSDCGFWEEELVPGSAVRQTLVDGAG